MKKALFLALILTLVFSGQAMAFEVRDQGVSKGHAAIIDCQDGVDCSDFTGNVLNITAFKLATRAEYSLLSPTAKGGTAFIITDADTTTNCGPTGTGSTFAICITSAVGEGNWLSL